jgi:hypothetical protein
MRDRGVDIGDARHTAVNQVESLAPQRRLKAVGDVAFDLLLDMNGLLPDRGVEGERLLDRR